MLWRIAIPIVLACAAATGAVIDGTAVRVGTHVVKDSDIQRDIRINAFLNGIPPNFNAASRKEAAGRLVDQELIRDQIQSGEYLMAGESDAEQLLAETKKDRFSNNDEQYRRELAKLGISESELKERLQWQLTVLRFIDTRFRPAAAVADDEVQKYYAAHRSELGGKPLDAVRESIEEKLTGDHINALLDQWLADQRKLTRIEFMEKALQ